MIVEVHALIIALRFNRYIVECKYISSPFETEKYIRFNRYIVECK